MASHDADGDRVVAGEAAEYSGHSPRRGGASEMSKAGIAGNVTMQRAGVTSDGWIAEYDDIEEERRLGGSLALEPR